jgi:hypothetical protein
MAKTCPFEPLLLQPQSDAETLLALTEEAIPMDRGERAAWKIGRNEEPFFSAGVGAALEFGSTTAAELSILASRTALG